MRIEILEFRAAMILIVAYIAAAMFRRGAGSDGQYRRGLVHPSIAFFLMEVTPSLLHLLNNQNKELSNLLLAIGIVVLIIAVLLFLNSLRLLCHWLLGDRTSP